MRDVELPRDAHAAVQLHGFLADPAARRADLVLDRADRAAGVVAALGIDHRRPHQQRLALLALHEHVDHAMLQRLEAADRHAELYALLGVFDGFVLERLHDADGLGAHGERRFVDRRFERAVTGIGVTEQRVIADRDVRQREFCSLVAVDGCVVVDRHARRIRRDREQADAGLVGLRTRRARRHDDDVGIAAVEHVAFPAAQDPAVVRFFRARHDVRHVVA